MTKDQARALCVLLDIQMGRGAIAFYATADLFGHRFATTGNLQECGWRNIPENQQRMDVMAAALFRDMADALESDK